MLTNVNTKSIPMEIQSLLEILLPNYYINDNKFYSFNESL